MYRSYSTAFPGPDRGTKSAAARTNSPFCPWCGSPLRLIGVDAVPGFEKHALQCSRCGWKESILVAPPARGTR